MNRYLILFDCDGTLVDSQHDIVAAMDHAFESVGLLPPARARTLGIVGLSVPEALRTLAPGLDGRQYEALADAFRRGGPALRGAERKQDLLYPGARELIAALAGREDIVLGVATGKSRRGVARLFEAYAWHEHFATIQTADTNPSKPDPAMIITAMTDVGVAPEHTVMIGDTSFDMAMARAADVRAIGVAWGYQTITELNTAGAHSIVHDFAGLSAALPAVRR